MVRISWRSVSSCSVCSRSAVVDPCHCACCNLLNGILFCPSNRGFFNNQTMQNFFTEQFFQAILTTKNVFCKTSYLKVSGKLLIIKPAKSRKIKNKYKFIRVNLNPLE